ncbi:hypothetical protein [Asticcacaulis machinosus]|uniref:Sel1 repeat-containing protein n=1 Tax=Asticcacaulis machinosus TaxID=2984211 RepID=A0ABT5HM73_9CAUL|nr:hypothetical protein [Asticcacaulis machinosus]MDC7677277.1 hypothetical protein [Asticcacaulis machinosus]
MIGDMYLKGMGTPKNAKTAIIWYRKIAEKPIHQQEHFDPQNPDTMSPRAEAAMMLAQIYIAGADVPRDLKEDLRWLERASANAPGEDFTPMKRGRKMWTHKARRSHHAALRRSTKAAISVSSAPA